MLKPTIRSQLELRGSEVAYLLIPNPAEVPDHDTPVSSTAGQDGFMLGTPPNLQVQ